MTTVIDSMQWETIAVPIVKGVDLNTRNRLVDPGTLVKAENVYYSKSGGPEKRRGHRAFTLYNAFMARVANPPVNNLYGYGLFNVDNLPTGACTYPQAGSIKDVVVYGDKELAWDGWRFYEPLEPGTSGKCKVVKATLPTYKSSQISNTTGRQDFACSSQNGTIRVVAYIGYDTTPSAYVNVYSVATGTLKFTAKLDNASADVGYVRTVSCGAYCHILVNDLTDSAIYCYSIHQDDNEITRVTTVTSCDTGAFDVYKFNEDRFLVCSLFDADVLLTWVDFAGRISATTLTSSFNATTDDSPLNVAVAVHPVSRYIMVFYSNGTEQRIRWFNEYGVDINAADVVIDTVANAKHFCVIPDYIDGSWHLYYDVDDGTNVTVYKQTRLSDGTQAGATKARHNARLASRGCRVGNVPFIWSVSTNTNYQTTYFLLDEDLLPVAKAEYGTAINRLSDPFWLPSMDFTVSEDGTWNNSVFTGAILYNERVDVTIPGDGRAYSHIAIKTYELNFLPDNLSYDEAGKALYIAGGQVWSYDGSVLSEANFPAGVETITTVAGAASSPSGTYIYRVDLCYKNAQNEECRAISFTSDPITVVSQSVDVTWRQPVTARTDSYYLVFRNENNGTLWYLCSGRDNSVRYDSTTATITFNDTMSDAALISKEQHPANAENYLDQIAAPACELITFGQNRLWIAGGEMLPGEVWPSRLFYPGQVPSYNWALGIQVNRTTEPVTAFAFQSDYGIVFKKTSTHIITGNISTNIFQGTVPNVQEAMADRGCINHKSVAKMYSSITFQSENGYKLIGAAGQMEDIGFPVESAKGDCIGAFIVKPDEHIRFYQSDNATLVFDYRRKLWTTFNFNNKPTAAVHSNRTGYAVIARDNSLLYETDDWYKDGDFDYHYVIKTAPLARELGGFQRVRRVYCMGEREGVPPPITVKIYQDGHSWWSEYFRWDSTTDINNTIIGSGAIGDNFIGCTTASEFRDEIWQWRYRLERQKCESIAIELTDMGSLNTNKWIPVAFGLEIGTMPGLNRLSDKNFAFVGRS